ncbi:hypothetical protein V8C35DRAFT_162972 [Trichoderma chlorosporum]
MASKMPTTSSPGLRTSSYRRSALPLSLIRHGGGLVGCGMLFGFLIPLVPYPRLGLTAHIQFCVQGCMVLAAGLVIQSDPLGSSHSQDGETSGCRVQLADSFSWWQEQAIYWGCTTIWLTMIAEVGNAWWGTKWTLPIAHQAAGLLGGGHEAARWMEMIVSATHFPLAPPLASVWPIILSKLLW